MPRTEAIVTKRRSSSESKSRSHAKNRIESRYSVGLPSSLAQQVEKYAERTHTSRSKAIASLVRLGIDSQAQRKQEFFKKLRENLAADDAKSQDRLVDEFWDLIMGR